MRISTGLSQLRLMTGRLWWQLRIIRKGHGDKGFSDGWYAVNPSHGQEGGESADSPFPSRVQGVSCFPGDEGRVGHIYRYRRLASAARPSGGRAMAGSSR